MDISEVLEATLHALCYLAALGILFDGFYFAFRSRRYWLRILLNVCSILLVAVTGFVLWVDFYLLAGTTMRRTPIYSPDRKLLRQLMAN